MNPILNTISIFFLWIILVLLGMATISQSPGEETPLAILIGGIYLAPLVCFITFIVSAIFQRKWIKNNRGKAILFAILLINCVLISIYHFKS